MFTEEGMRVPVTLLSLGPCIVCDVKTKERDGYSAIQLGYQEVDTQRVNKAQAGYFVSKKLPAFKHLIEFRVQDVEKYEVGQKLTVEAFEVGGKIDIAGISIGKGFSGGMKRWGFKGGRASHGAHKTHRSPGSIGQCQSPGRVFKNKKMAGHYGNKRVKVKNLVVMGTDVANNMLMIKGTVPGSKESLVSVSKP
jgi:large subunit ribosomal protein L3